MTPGGKLTTLHNFQQTDGDNPVSALVQGTDGNLYGTVSYGGKHPNFGTVFKITPGGKLTTLHNFDSQHGSYPYAGLIQATNGRFYGATYAGGPSTACPFGCGTVFSLSVGLYPFVQALPNSGSIDGPSPLAVMPTTKNNTSNKLSIQFTYGQQVRLDRHSVGNLDAKQSFEGLHLSGFGNSEARQQLTQ